MTYQPEVGDIVFFPSSLHHKTIPFTTDADRIIVSFDLVPNAQVNEPKSVVKKKSLPLLEKRKKLAEQKKQEKATKKT